MYSEIFLNSRISNPKKIQCDSVNKNGAITQGFNEFSFLSKILEIRTVAGQQILRNEVNS